MRHGSLFSGIGGFDLAAEWMGWENVFHCEWNEFGQRVLKYYWPNAISYGDITKTDFTIHRGEIDILTGGFPCQPYSMAGKRKGKEDERHLWPEMLRTIREIHPGWVVGENVPGIINWSGGLVFHEVQTDLETEGYEVFPVVLPACGVNAPHKRERIWFVAHNTNSGIKRMQQRENGILSNNITSNSRCVGRESGTAIGGTVSEEFRRAESNKRDKSQNVTDTDIQRQQTGGKLQKPSNKRQSARNDSESNVTNPPCYDDGYTQQKRRASQQLRNSFGAGNGTWNDFPTQSPLCSRDDGFSSRLDGITFPKFRNESIKAYGNAIVPNVAYQIFKAIEQIK
jgi:DNA (cytosine-5)-methyltransferase 1